MYLLSWLMACCHVQILSYLNNNCISVYPSFAIIFNLFGFLQQNAPIKGRSMEQGVNNTDGNILLESHPFVRLSGALNVTFAILGNVNNASSLVEIPHLRPVNFLANLAALQRNVEDFAQFV